MVSTLSSVWILPMPQKLRSTAWNQGRSRVTFLFRISAECLELKNERRSAHYHPTIWETQRIESFDTPYTYKSHAARLEELKRMTRLSFETAEDPRELLKLIDATQRLGVAYHFEDEIKVAVSRIYQDETINDLHITALRFRILREHGFSISTEVFNRFLSEDGRFLDNLGDDDELEGILSLYEASHFAMPGEDILDEAMNFSLEQLKYSSSGFMKSHLLSTKVEQSLEVPLHWRMPRIEARNFIDLYELDEAKSPYLLEFAKLDYNLVQSVYQIELKELASWWRDLGFKENLHFSRDRLMENYLWVIGIISEPHHSKCRIGLTKFVCILTAIDDIYDIYGSPDELESFTSAVKRWDIEAMTNLPLYMKICYIAMFNFGNEVIYDGLKSHGFDVSSYIKEGWLNLCRSYLVEARWFSKEHTPTLDEYLGNAYTSVGGPAAIAHICVLLLGSSISKPSLESCFTKGSKLIHWSSLITRISDDLGTSKDESERGDVKKSVECYMKERGVSEEEARNQIKELRRHSWKIVNKEMISNNDQSLPNAMVRACLNMSRTSHCIFQHGDGIGTSTGVTRDRLEALIVKPVPFQHSMVHEE